jgi:hypothetical protein
LLNENQQAPTRDHRSARYPRVIDLFDADAFGTNPATVSYLPCAGIEGAPGRTTYEFPMTSAARSSRISMPLRPHR